MPAFEAVSFDLSSILIQVFLETQRHIVISAANVKYTSRVVFKILEHVKKCSQLLGNLPL